MTTKTHNEQAEVDPAVAAWLDAGEAVDPPDVSGDWSALQQELASEGGLGAARGLPTTVRLAVAVGLALALAALVFFGTRRPDFAVIPVGRLLADVALLLVPLLLLVAAFMHPIYRPPLSPKLRWSFVGLAAIAVLVSALLPAAHLDHPASLQGGGEDFVPRAVACFGFGVSLGLPMLLGLRLLGRQGTGWRRFVPSMVVAGAAVLAGCLGLYLHCPITLSKHLLAGHAAVWIPFAALALLLGRDSEDG
jgi:hypothetical protein